MTEIDHVGFRGQSFDTGVDALVHGPEAMCFVKRAWLRPL